LRRQPDGSANSTLGVAIFAGSKRSSKKLFMSRAYAVYPNLFAPAQVVNLAGLQWADPRFVTRLKNVDSFPIVEM
jgi:hypothetical protein